jgi:hypothetical protein
MAKLTFSLFIKEKQKLNYFFELLNLLLIRFIEHLVIYCATDVF